MYISFDAEKLNNVLKDFYNATGINIQLFREDLSFFGCKHIINNSYCRAIQNNTDGKKACINSDKCLKEKCKKTKKTETHICHAGLVDVAVPILCNDDILGYILLGQMKTETPFKAIGGRLAAYGINPVEMEKHYESLPYFEPDKIQSIASIASMLAKYILTENMMKPGINRNMEKATGYIRDNLDKNLTVRSISDNINISKSVLYKNFHSSFNCTVNQYINTKRVEKSTELLTDSDLSIEEISRKVGFSSAAYYSKIFKKLKGTSPLKFRKMMSEE
ncbi:MAG: PocR ligand-binding domain-containing protein [Clostridia bacterium]|nr:PocR ligand-binding domain-containing protein [Clostridia bacterium]